MDLTALQAALAGLGPWGIAIGIALTFAAQWLLKRKSPTPSPAPTPTPEPPPKPAPSPTPKLDALLDWLRLWLTKTPAPPATQSLPPPSADIDDDTALRVLQLFTEKK